MALQQLLLKKPDDQSSPLASLLLQNGVNPSAVNLGTSPDVKSTDPTLQTDGTKQPNQLDAFLRSGILPTAGSIVGGAIGGITGGGLGAIPGAGIGGGLGELFRRGVLRVMGENPDDKTNPNSTIVNDLGSAAAEGAIDSVFQGVGGLALKGVAKVGKGLADTLGVTPDAFVRRAMPGLTPTKFAAASSSQATEKDLNRNIATALLADKDSTGKNIFQTSPDEWKGFVANRKNELGQAMTDATDAQSKAEGKVFDPAQVGADIKNAIVTSPKPLITYAGSTQLQDGGDQVLGAIDKEINNAKVAYGDKWDRTDIRNFRQTLDAQLSTFTEDGKLDVGGVKRVVANRLRDSLSEGVPGLEDLNKQYGAYADVERTLDRSLTPGLPGAGTFGSVGQTAPLEVAANSVAPGTGGAVWLGSVLANNIMKSQAGSAKIANVLFKIRDLGSNAPTPLKNFYNVMQPVVVQGIHGATRGTDPNAPDDPNHPANLASTLLPPGNQAGLTPDPTSSSMAYKTSDQVTNPDGSPNASSLGITKEQIAIAMLADPKHAAIYKDVYGILNPAGAAGGAKVSAQTQSQLSKLEAAQGVINQAQDLMGRIHGQGLIQGNLSLLGAHLLKNNPDISTYEALRNGTLPILTRVIGGDVGNLNEQEQVRAAQLMPQVTDSDAIVRQKFGLLQTLLDEKRKSLLNHPGASDATLLGNPTSSTGGSSDTLNSIGQ